MVTRSAALSAATFSSALASYRSKVHARTVSAIAKRSHMGTWSNAKEQSEQSHYS